MCLLSLKASTLRTLTNHAKQITSPTSFDARMSGMPGPKRDEKGELTRKAASLKRWNCPGW